jgi:hypothetical protein
LKLNEELTLGNGEKGNHDEAIAMRTPDIVVDISN